MLFIETKQRDYKMLNVKYLTDTFKVSAPTAYKWCRKPPSYIAEAIVAANSNLTPLDSHETALYWQSLGRSSMTASRWKRGTNEAPLAIRYAAAYHKQKIKR